MELVQNIARLGSGTGESGETITRAKYCTGKAILPYPTAELSYLFLRVGFYPTLSYLILLYPTLSYLILLYPTFSLTP